MSSEPILPPAAEPHDEDLEASLQQLASKLFPQDEVQKNMQFMEEMDAKVTELETRLSLAEESKAVAMKERDAADEARKKLEKTLAELLSKFASARENHSVVLREVEEIRQANAARRDAVDAEHREVEQLRETNATLKAENDELQQKIESQFLNLEVFQTQLRSEHQTTEELRAEVAQLRKRAGGDVKAAIQDHERTSSEMVTSVDDLLEQLHGMRELLTQRCNQMQSAATVLGGQLKMAHAQLSEHLQTDEERQSKRVSDMDDMAGSDDEDVPPARAAESGLRQMESGVRAV